MLERIQTWLRGASQKAQSSMLRFFAPWATTEWPTITFGRLAEEGYRTNSAVYACVRLWANTFPEPELHLWESGDRGKVKLADHPLRKLLAEPNPHMSERELMSYLITYAAIGGSAFLWKERARDGSVIGLWPLHVGQMQPIADPNGWLLGYRYEVGGYIETIAPSEVVHVMWAPDPLRPLLGLSPLVAAARAVDTDNEALRYAYALLSNDAMPRTIIASKHPMANVDEEKARFQERFGGDNYGAPIFLEGSEVTIERLGASLNELAAEALHNIPETRIAAAFEVQAVMVGLNVGLQRAIQGAPRELQEYWTETVRVPRWRMIASQIRRGLAEDFDLTADQVLEHDLSEVRALTTDRQEREDAIRSNFEKRLITRNEAREELGLPPVEGGDEFEGDASRITIESPSRPMLPAPDSNAESKAKNRFEEDRDELASIYETTVAAALEQLQAAVVAAAESGSLEP